MEGKGKMLEWTGERYLPFVDTKISGAEIHYELLHRYHFALHFVKDEKMVKHASCKYVVDHDTRNKYFDH